MSFITLVKCIPAILGLIKSIEAAIVKYNTDKTVSAHIDEVTNAFKTGDVSKLNAAFNNTEPVVQLPVGASTTKPTT